MSGLPSGLLCRAEQFMGSGHVAFPVESAVWRAAVVRWEELSLGSDAHCSSLGVGWGHTQGCLRRGVRASGPSQETDRH